MGLVAIVDDDSAVRDSVQDLLDFAGFSTAAFGSAESLLQSERLPSVECLVTDLCMPGMNGLQLHQRLMASKLSIPAILITGCAEEQVRAQALEAGVAGYLAKPLRSDELLACVRSAMQDLRPGHEAIPGDALAVEQHARIAEPFAAATR